MSEKEVIEQDIGNYTDEEFVGFTVDVIAAAAKTLGLELDGLVLHARDVRVKIVRRTPDEADPSAFKALISMGKAVVRGTRVPHKGN